MAWVKQGGGTFLKIPWELYGGYFLKIWNFNNDAEYNAIKI